MGERTSGGEPVPEHSRLFSRTQGSQAVRMCLRVLIIGLALLLGMSAFVEARRRKQRKQASESAAAAQMAQCQAHKTCTACWRARCGWCTGPGFMPRCGVDSLDACDIDHLIGAAPQRIDQASCPEDPGSTAGWKVEKWARGHRHVGSGGWEEETVSADFENFTNGLGCNIDRRSVSSLSVADFEKDYYLPRKPVILTDVGVAGNAHSWARKAWTKEALRAIPGYFGIGTPYDAQVHRRSVKMMTVEEFLDMLASQPDKARYMWSETNETQPPIGKHAGERVDGHEVSVMASLLPTPSELADSSTSDMWGRKLLQFAMGATGSGIAFHAHKDGWCEVIYGTKLWWFYPPQTVAPLHNVFRAHIDWLAEAAVALPPEEQPMSCVQEAGEIMYVPEAWNHATINIGNTIALAQQRQEPRRGGYLHSVKEALNLMKLGKLHQATQAVEQARLLEPDHFHAMLVEAMLKKMQGDVAGASALGNLMTNTLCERWPELSKRCHEWAKGGGLQDNMANLFT